MTTVHVIVPDSIDDPTRPSGGNVYDRRICDGLAAAGWTVHVHPLPGDWPKPDSAARPALARMLTALAEGAIVLIDGLIASAAHELPAFAHRLHLVVLVHMPLAQGHDDSAGQRSVEGAALRAATALVTTSAWTKSWLVDNYALEPGRIHVVEPGADAATPAPGTRGGDSLLCIASVTAAKGLDLLVSALGELEDLSWHCVCVGAIDRDPEFMEQRRSEVRERGIADRIRFVGIRTGADLDAAYAASDLVVVCSRAETYGLVVTEALARGIPVIASAVGGVPEALGYGTGSIRPGILVSPGDSLALAAALRRWLSDADLRRGLRQVALQRRETLSSWAAAADRMSEVLATVAV